MNTSLESGDVAVIGAGVIGLSLAFELAGRGAQVRVFDTGEPAKAASWAAAGMLAPRTEHLADRALRELCESSLAAYPQFVQEVRDASGVDPHLRLDGVLHAAYDDEAFARLQVWAAQLLREGSDVAILCRKETQLAEPALGKGVKGCVIVPGEGQVDNRRLGSALLQACRSRGVRVHSGVRTLRVDCDARRVRGVSSEVGYVAAAAVVNTSGAWAARVPGVPRHCVPDVYPVAGEMLAVELPLGFMRRTTWIPGAYLVPRSDGRLLVGATAQERGFDARVTAGGIAFLLQAALRAVPALAGFTISETWAGLRPATRDGRPFIGPTELQGYFLACGHYRNGILLAPATARLLADSIMKAEAGLPAFGPQRAGTEGATA